jgi:hypothetical protein
MAWKPPVNYRTSAVVTPTPEAIEIGADGVALLAEAPADPATNAMTVTVGGNARARVTGTPAAGQYRVKTQSVIYADLQPHTEYLPLLEFHSSDAGLSGTCSYYRTGTVVTTELYQSMIDFLRPLTGYASSATLPAATTDRTQRGCPGDMAFTTGGQLYYSDGTQWFAVAGGAGAQFSRTKTVDAGAAVKVALTKTASADAAVFNSTTKSQDITAQAAVLAHQTQAVAADGEVVYNVQARTQTLAADAAVRGTRTQTATADAALKFAVTKTASADGVVDAGSSASISLVGTPVSGTGTGSAITLPSGRQAGDIIVIAFGSDIARTGYTRKYTGNTNFGLSWRRATGDSNDNISVPNGNAYSCSIYRGCVASGDPFEAASASVATGDTMSGALSIPQITTATNGAWVLAAASGYDTGWDDGDGGSGENTGPTWAAASGAASTLDASATTSTSSGAAMWHSEKATAGATGTCSVRFYMTGYSPYAQGTSTWGVLLALKPA